MKLFRPADSCWNRPWSVVIGTIEYVTIWLFKCWLMSLWKSITRCSVRKFSMPFMINLYSWPRHLMIVISFLFSGEWILMYFGISSFMIIKSSSCWKQEDSSCPSDSVLAKYRNSRDHFNMIVYQRFSFEKNCLVILLWQF